MGRGSGKMPERQNVIKITTVGQLTDQGWHTRDTASIPGVVRPRAVSSSLCALGTSPLQWDNALKGCENESCFELWTLQIKILEKYTIFINTQQSQSS